jgi:lipopolysaccharide transport system permease protein
MSVLHYKDGKAVDAVGMGYWARLSRFGRSPFVSAWHHRELIMAVLRRELRERFKGSVAGWVWAVTAPLLSLITYTLVFSGAATLPNKTQSTSSADYALFIFGGLIAFNFFTEMMYRAPSLLHEYSHYIKQTMFPAEMLAVISTLRAMCYSVIGLALMLVCQLIFTKSLHWTVILLPFWFATLVALLVGVTWLLSAMGAFTRDTAYLVMSIAPILMFATPVFYSHESLSPTMQMLMYANIMTGFIEIIRDLVVFGRIPNLLVCAWTLAVSVVTFWFGYWYFLRQRDQIADVL